MTSTSETITLGGGCFWCIEAVFENVKGVTHVESGYSNGHVERPTYEAVCTGTTGHNEVVRVTFDPAQIGLPEILRIFFTVHDPASLNRQGNDVGTQYRSAVYVNGEAQAQTAREMIGEMNRSGRYSGPIVTEVEPLKNYSRAEDYHQHYFANNPGQGYCAFVVAPKVEKFRRLFADRVVGG